MRSLNFRSAGLSPRRSQRVIIPNQKAARKLILALFHQLNQSTKESAQLIKRAKELKTNLDAIATELSQVRTALQTIDSKRVLTAGLMRSLSRGKLHVENDKHEINYKLDISIIENTIKITSGLVFE